MARTNAALKDETATQEQGEQQQNQQEGTAWMFEGDGGALVMDLAGIEEAKFEVLPKGWYDAEIDGWDYGLSKNGAPQFTATYHLLHPDYTKVKLKAWYTFTAKGLPYVKANLCRFARDIFGGQFNPQEVADSGVLIGRPVRIRLDQGEYEGQNRNSVANVVPAGEGSGNAGQSGGQKFFS